MCRACGSTSDGQGRHCARPEGFSETESDRRNRGRNLDNAQEHLASGDPQAAANSMARAVAAHRTASGVSQGGPAQDPAKVSGPVVDFIVSPSDVPAAIARIERSNVEREKVGLNPLSIDTTRQYTPVDGDPIMVMESTTIRVYGGTQDELRKVSVGSVRSEPERKVDTNAVLQAASTAARLDGGVYITREAGGNNSTPAQVIGCLSAAPRSERRNRLAPTHADKEMAGKVRMWIRSQQSTSDYNAALRHSVAEKYMSLRDVGMASSAVKGYLQHRVRVDQMRADYEAQKARDERAGASAPRGDANPVYSTNPRGSRWLAKPEDKVTVKARIERIVMVDNAQGYQPRALHIMRTPDGDLVRWMASEPHGLMEGDTLTFQGTIKGHSTFNNEKQTEVWYCKNLVLHQPESV